MQANSAFGCDLHRVAARAKPGNLFYSPYSITVALGMTRQGAVGATAAEMDGVLHTGKLDTSAFAAVDKGLEPRMVTNGRERQRLPTFELHAANTLWGQIGMKFEEPFLKQMIADFDARRSSGSTSRRRRPHGVGSICGSRSRRRSGSRTSCRRGCRRRTVCWPSATRSTSRRRGTSRSRTRRTKPAPFTNAKGEKVEVNMMANSDHLAYMENDDVQVAEIPYRGHDTSMVVILPKKVDGLPAFETALTGEKLTGLLGKLERRRVALKLPKFEITLPLRLDETLQAMGMKRAFTARADFSKMTKEDRLMIGAVLHKAFVAVDEVGTEAAAATIVLMKRGGASTPDEVRWTSSPNHPFLFLIRHRKTGCRSVHGPAVHAPRPPSLHYRRGVTLR